ncbi:hypothetical protein QKW52_11535 [Bacillus sonorensis]|nr:hypothetical protein [Bacillus sonorensis]
MKTTKEKAKLQKVAKAGGGQLIEADTPSEFKEVWKEEGVKLSK